MSTNANKDARFDLQSVLHKQLHVLDQVARQSHQDINHAVAFLDPGRMREESWPEARATATLALDRLETEMRGLRSYLDAADIMIGADESLPPGGE